MNDNFGAQEAQEQISTWTFEGKEYPLFVVNGKDSAAVHIKRKADDPEPIAILSSNFNWIQHKSKPFIDRVDIEFVDKKNIKEDTIERENRSLTKRNADFFDTIVESGEYVKIEDGEYSAPQPLTREQMLSRKEELKSNIVDKWLYVGFRIERYFEKGMDEFDALTGDTSDTIKFLLKIGSPSDPAHVLLLEFNAPSKDARRAYNEHRTESKSRMETSEIEKTTTTVDWERKFKFAKKHLIGVQGALIDGDGISTDEITAFKTLFNPDWFIRLGDALNDSFNIGGK